MHDPHKRPSLAYLSIVRQGQAFLASFLVVGMTMLALQYLALPLHTRTNRGQVDEKPPFRHNRPKSQKRASKAGMNMKRTDAEPAMSMQVVTLE